MKRFIVTSQIALAGGESAGDVAVFTFALKRAPEETSVPPCTVPFIRRPPNGLEA